MVKVRGITGTARDLHDWIVRGGHGVPESITGSGHVRYRLSNGLHYDGPLTSKKRTTYYNGRATVRALLARDADAYRARRQTGAGR